MALLGISPLMFLVIGGLSAVYQFWIHTRHIPKLGWLEKYMVTPSSHRAHHGSNAVYMDKNYGGVFIIWDRFFGSYQEELDDDPVRYGMSRPLRSWNPVWANIVGYLELAQDARHTARWQDKLSIWFRRTGWRPVDAEAQYPRAKRPKNYQNYDAKPSQPISVYAAVQYILSTLAAIAYLSISDTQSLLFNASMVTLFVLQLTLISLLFENKPHTLAWELLRLSAALVTALACQSLGLLPAAGTLAVLASLLLSAAVAINIMRARKDSNASPLTTSALPSAGEDL
jgi:hypothetical protein